MKAAVCIRLLIAVISAVIVRSGLAQCFLNRRNSDGQAPIPIICGAEGWERHRYMGKLVTLQMKMKVIKYPLTRREKTKYFAKSIIVSRRNIGIEMTVQTLRLLMMMKIIIIAIKFIN